MIRFLRITQLAVIDELELEFEPGLTVLTGETGAGKSIVVGALGLLVGERASTDLVRTGESTASVQAVFEKPDGTEVLVRREIGSHGRSRAYVDDALVTSSTLKALGTELLDLHGQHDHQVLLDPKAHLDLLDQHGALSDERDAVRSTFAAWREARAALTKHRHRGEQGAERLDVVRFQLNEILSARPQTGEADALQAQKLRLANADAIRQLSTKAHQALYEGEGAVMEMLTTIWRDLEALGRLDPTVSPLQHSRDTVTSHLEELAFALGRYASDVDSSPERLQEVEDRLAVLEGLARKYGQGSLGRVMERQQELATELRDLEGGTDRLEALESSLSVAAADYRTAARGLSRKRKAVAGGLTKQLESLLHELAMERTRCEFRIDEVADEEKWSDRGTDAGELFLSPNEGEEPRALARIASGGELSRIMLALKTAASIDAPGRTLVFDEVDAGIGGRVADVVGRRLRRLGDRFQVLCVTHLPQIAAHGARQIEVTKRAESGRTVTRAVRLGNAERVEAIARMMTAGAVTKQGRLAAQELLERSVAGESEHNTKGRSEKAKGRRRG